MNIKKFENYMSREEMCQSLCRCGYNMSELEECSNQELEEMCRNEEEENNSHNHNMTQEAKGEKWIKDAIKKPGSLRKSLKKKEGENVGDEGDDDDGEDDDNAMLLADLEKEEQEE